MNAGIDPIRIERKKKMNLCKNISVIAIAAACVALAAKNPMVGGQEMFPTKNIVQNAVNSATRGWYRLARSAVGAQSTRDSPAAKS